MDGLMTNPFWAEEFGTDVYFVSFGEVALVVTGQEPVGLDIGWGKPRYVNGRKDMTEQQAYDYENDEDARLALNVEFNLTIGFRYLCDCSRYFQQRRSVLIPEILSLAKERNVDPVDLMADYARKVHDRHGGDDPEAEHERLLTFLSVTRRAMRSRKEGP